MSLCFEHNFEDFFHIKYKSGKIIKFFLPRIFSNECLGIDPSDWFTRFMRYELREINKGNEDRLYCFLQFLMLRSYIMVL